jgi:GAF domain-containing protein
VRQTPRDASFCGHAILGDDVMVVPDALLDARFADSPLVTGHPHVRFYAGAPLRLPDGSRIGMLCLMDRRPRDLSDTDRARLRDMAGLVERELREPPGG